MSKRGAEEYITKEHGSTPNDPSEGAKVKMATAAQLAKRKMAVPKSRAGRMGQSPVPSTGPSNPFSSTNSFGATQNSQVFPNSGGVTFGASQSFPPGDTSNGGFNFSVPGQSSSFTFGQPAPSNPFATLNGSANSQTPASQDPNDTIMESPQKKPAFGTNVFGPNGTSDAGTASTGFSFGQSAGQPSSQPTFAFGQSQGFGSTPSGGSLFGQTASKPADSNATIIFGKPTEAEGVSPAASPAFGQSTNTPQQSLSSGFSFGQSATTAPSSTSTSTPAFGFGQSASSAPASKPSFGFGQTSTQPTSNGTLFGTSTQNGQPVFNPPTTASQPTASTSPFGTTPSAPSSNNVFGGFGSPKLAESSPSPEPSTLSETSKPSLFGQPVGAVQDPTKIAAATQDQTKINPFAGLFGQTTSKQPEVPAKTEVQSPKPLFNFAAPTQSSGLFATPKTSNEDSTKPAEDNTKKAFFDFGTPATNTKSDLFGMQPSTNPFIGITAKRPETQKSGTEKLNPQQPLFGPTKDTSKEESTKPQATSSFGGFSANNASSTTKADTSNPFAGFGLPKSSEPEPTTIKSSTLPKPSSTSLFENMIGSKPLQTPSDIASATTKTRSDDFDNPVSSKVDETPVDGPKRSVNTHPPTRIPPYLNGDDYKAYDSNFRLHSLNREFQKRIASLDPSLDDFENIVRNYVAARESIGESIGLYTRNIAGMKRKADEESNQHEQETSSAKRSKPSDDLPSKPLFGTSQPSSSAFQPVSSSSLASSTPSSHALPSKSTTAGLSSASAIFNSMIPNGKNATTIPSSSNPFANLANSGVSSSTNDAASKPTFAFGNSSNKPTSAGSTTPTKSPPKKAAFEMPKFAAPSGGLNFMDAFKQQSEQSAAKFAEEAKAKRKAEDFDSDEDDEEEWNRKYEEEEKAKKAKLAAVAQKGFTPILGNDSAPSDKPVFNPGPSSSATSTTPKPASGFSFAAQTSGKSSDKPIDISDNDASGEGEEETEEASGASGDGDDEDEEDDGDDEEAEAEDDDELPEDEVGAEDDDEDDEDIETALARSRSQGRSLFDRVTPNPSIQKDSTPNLTAAPKQDAPRKSNVFGNPFEKSTPEAPSFSPLTPGGSKDTYVPSKTFNFTPTPPVTSSTPTPGASIFAGGAIKDGPIAGEGLFGSRPSTPSNADKPKPNFFGNMGTPSMTSAPDQTWKKGSEIKFGTFTNEAPAVSITAPSPLKADNKPFANLFGAHSSSNSASSIPSIGFSFGQSPVPGFLAAASHLAGGSGTNSGFSSRATSPGTTDNESVATNEEDYSQDAQVSLLETRPGEENENVLYEVRAKALRFYSDKEIVGTKLDKGWNVAGVGNVRLLKHKQTGKTRLVMRAEPGANIILNTNLQPEVTYSFVTQGTTGAVKFNVFTSEGGQGWTLKVKTAQQGQELAKLMEDNKKG